MPARLPATSLMLLALTQSCVPHNVPLVTLSCPAAAPEPPAAPDPPAAPAKTAAPVAGDGPHVAPLPPMRTGPEMHTGPLRQIVFRPYTLIVNRRVAAVVLADADSTLVAHVWAKLDPEKIKTIEVYRPPRAQQCYPAAVGTLVVITGRLGMSAAAMRAIGAM